MELFELKEAIEEIEADKRSWERKVQRCREELEPKAVDITKEKVSGGGVGRSIDDVMHSLIHAERMAQKCKNLLDDYYQEVREKEEVYQKYNDRDKQLYLDKKFYKINNSKLQLKYGLDISTIYKICKKIEKKVKK